MPHSFGYRARTRDMFARPFRQSGMIKLSTYLRTFKVGDYVDIKANGAIHKGMPHKFYHGRTGRVYNVTKRAVGVRVNKIVGNRIIHKHINVRIEHVHQSKCRQGFLTRVKENELKKKEAHATGVRAVIKRQPTPPKEAYTLKTKGTKPITMAPQPFVDLMGTRKDTSESGATAAFPHLGDDERRHYDGDGRDHDAAWLDNLERKDPEGYKQLIATMKAQIESESAGPAGAGMQQQGDANAALFDMLSSSKAAAAAGGNSGGEASDFKPRFPGNKVMEPNGLTAKQEGVYIDVEPGFVMKTSEVKSGKKVFVNVCFSDSIQSFSQQKKLDDEGKEQEGIHVPLSLGAPHEVKDKKGIVSLAFDVAVNTQVVEDCRQDKTGSFRNFVCELAIEYIDQKYKIQLNARYKLPRLSYRGDLPPPKHYIRKTQAPMIQEVTTSKPSTTTSTTSTNKKAPSTNKQHAPPVSKTAVARCELHEIVVNTRLSENSKASNNSRALCTRVSAVEKTGKALSPQVLQHAGDQLDVSVYFTTPVLSTDDIELELGPELLCVKAVGHQDLSVFLPYPVIVNSAQVALNLRPNSLHVKLSIDKKWDSGNADCGSAPWLLAQALDGGNVGGDNSSSHKQEVKREPLKPKSLAEMFHLEQPNARDSEQVSSATITSNSTQATKWDPVDEYEELPEDHFHRKDMMSMHILEQRKAERDQKAKESEAKRRAQRAEVQEKQRKAKEAGKSWQEMYPNEPETTYIDMDDIFEKQKTRQSTQTPTEAKEQPDTQAKVQLLPTEDAIKVAAAWSENKKKDKKLDLRSALAFDLLD